MARITALPLLAVSFVTCVAQSNFSGVWHLVNVQSVVCENAPGYTLINISRPTDDLSRPHIFTVFRTTTSPVSLDFTAKDSAGKDVATVDVTLQQARRLSELAVSSPRQLSSRRRWGGGGGGGSSYSSPRRRTPSPSPAPYSSPRRRTPSPTPSTGQTGSRRRTFGYDNKAYNNPSNPAAGNYGYQTPSAAAGNFGGKIPTGTPYGYTGANAYSGSSGSGAKIAMAAGAGLLAGYVGSQLLSPSWTGYSREQMLNFPCRGPGNFQGLCSTCVSLHGAQNCAMEISPKIDATRDDLLSTGFVPSTLTWPIVVNITKISGVDFDPSKICPNASDPTWSASQKQLFLTLTMLQELASGSDAAKTSSSMSWYPIFGAILAICGCCCCGLFAFRMYKGGGQSYGGGYGSSSESDWSEAEPHPHGAMGYPGHQPYGAHMPQPGYNPYWQGGGAPQPIQGVVVQGSPVGQPARAGAGAAFGASGSFMDTAAPSGASWAQLCQGQDVAVDSSGMIAGPWGECLAWAVAYEKQNPGWHQDPRFQVEGPAGQVIGEISAKANPAMLPQVVEAAERLEEACQQAIQSGQPLPIINRRV